jgi:hypothetical protein
MNEKKFERTNWDNWPILAILLGLSLIFIGTMFPPSVESRSLFDSPIIIINYTPTPRPTPVLNLTFEPLTLADGLKGHWQLNETDTGDRFDSSNAANTLTNIGGLSWDSFTLVGWIKREDLGQTMVISSKYEWGATNRAYRLQISATDRLRFIVSPDGVANNSNYYIDGNSLLTSTTDWYHVAAVFDAGSRRIKLYLNGNLDGNKAIAYDSVFQSNAPFMLGANLGEGQVVQHFDGQLDEWRAYDRALSQAEIQSLMGAQ